MRFVILALIVVAGAARTTPAYALEPRQCRTTDLAISEAHSQGGGGSFFLNLRLRNRSSAACGLAGHPGIALLDHHGRAIKAIVAYDPNTKSLVLAPDARVYVTLRYIENQQPGQACPKVGFVRFIAPNDTHLKTVNLSNGSEICGSPRGVAVGPIKRP